MSPLKCLLVRKCLCAKVTFCAILSLWNFIASCKIVFVQKYLCAILCTLGIFSPCSILYAQANLTATHKLGLHMYFIYFLNCGSSNFFLRVWIVVIYLSKLNSHAPNRNIFSKLVIVVKCITYLFLLY